ncbi:nitrate reductase molybdenum cofactor assembly chaperone [Virgibacillus halophilus]|uniref:Nitrate reductase molybdenum cofactor assembly chaperone n=1 Tax=Tigheibacillus halophilus TaxID=361280 RepID=A0ABU5CDL2_9BACI|nr:nitrate reductase molybdenum cofactor assembly chaperone [Virgibacillus halophilus]
MDQQARALLLVTSRLLEYPDIDLDNLQKEITDYGKEHFTSPELQEEVELAITSLQNEKLSDVQMLYVQTFDLKSKHGLYLTAHELGDSNKRGAALIKLQKIINKAGFDRIDDELADYIPMLLEFLAVSDDSNDNERMCKRLGVALSRILRFLPSENLYHPVLSLLMKYVFPNPTKEDVEKLEFDREEADLEELPYPIMYH